MSKLSNQITLWIGKLTLKKLTLYLLVSLIVFFVLLCILF